MDGKETVLNLKFFEENGKSVLKQKIQISYEDGSSEIVWKPVEGQDIETSQPSFSDRFKNDTFQPHHYNQIKTDTITKKVKMNINFNDEKISDSNVLSHIERSVRIDNIMKKLLNDPSIIKKEGFDFKGNNELKKALSLICVELGGEWTEIPNYFK
jgi:hypothetical protein